MLLGRTDLPLMSDNEVGGHLRPVGDEDRARGEALKARRLRLGIKSLRELEEKTGVARTTITKAEAGEASRPTYERLEAWFDRFEHEITSEAEVVEPGGGVMTLSVEGIYGVAKVTVQAPVEDADELRAFFRGLLADLRDQSPEAETD